MNWKELVDQVADETSGTSGDPITKGDVETVMRATFDVMFDVLKDGEDINVQGLGKFVITDQKERKGRNVQTGEAITIPARKAVKFRPAKTLKDAVA